jgi:hypothetical protein
VRLRPHATNHRVPRVVVQHLMMMHVALHPATMRSAPTATLSLRQTARASLPARPAAAAPSTRRRHSRGRSAIARAKGKNGDQLTSGLRDVCASISPSPRSFVCHPEAETLRNDRSAAGKPPLRSCLGLSVRPNAPHASRIVSHEAGAAGVLAVSRRAGADTRGGCGRRRSWATASSRNSSTGPCWTSSFSSLSRWRRCVGASSATHCHGDAMAPLFSPTARWLQYYATCLFSLHRRTQAMRSFRCVRENAQTQLLSFSVGRQGGTGNCTRPC